ncbi:hypothetical protein CMUS01_08492 [Colletotrichum musicola]|uniref:Uncharacterized protein n=1 Tax=Colletotrichum musicola TaxID=2175873 RepID=A0A8H6KCU7_9PEZI|nr:hypothetical protein CMUS01_08492 [Colletotrichum musicola]
MENNDNTTQSAVVFDIRHSGGSSCYPMLPDRALFQSSMAESRWQRTEYIDRSIRQAPSAGVAPTSANNPCQPSDPKSTPRAQGATQDVGPRQSFLGRAQRWSSQTADVRTGWRDCPPPPSLPPLGLRLAPLGAEDAVTPPRITDPFAESDGRPIVAPPFRCPLPPGEHQELAPCTPGRRVTLLRH